jgi:DNA-binding MarR family transcriptional regulator
MFKIGFSKFTDGKFKQKFLSMTDRFKDENELHPKSKLILHLLEVRSYNNNGDVKFHDKMIAEVLQLSLRTVQRHIKYLEDAGFIARITKHYYDSSKNTGSERQKFYSDRIIRCFRIFLANHCEEKPKDSIGWKNDFRPKINQNEYNVSPGWFARENDDSGIQPIFTNLYELFKNNIMSKEMYDMYYKLKDKWFDGDEKAITILGKKAFT